MIASSHFHPIAVHFPIALILIGFVIDLIASLFKTEPCLTKTGYYLQVIGMVATIIAWGTGYYFTSQLGGEAETIRLEHKLFATLTLVFIILSTTLRILLNYLKKETGTLRWIVLCLYLCAFVFVGYTGYLGGVIVQEYLIGL